MAKKGPKSKPGATAREKKRASTIASRARKPHSAGDDGQPQQHAPDDPPDGEFTFPIVAVGASAGGLEAFSQLLEPLPADPGIAIVLVQHLAPKNASLLPELLSTHCKLPVQQVTEGTTVAPNQVYVIPPDATMTLRDGILHLTQRSSDHTQHTPIDTFFTSLADYAQSGAIGVILSGTASDGVLGIKAIKAAGGITLAQRPDSAKFAGMPRAAIATEVIDLVLAPSEIANELLRIARHPYLHRSRAPREAEERPMGNGQLGRVFQLLRKATGVDFTCYKPPTIRRRIQRRMMLHKIGDFDHYLKHLEENPTEVQSLYQDILIHVTRFFREPESFEALKSIVFPRIAAGRNSDSPIRIWVPGCSTGEEPYSVAITLVEYLNEQGSILPIQIFATDLSEAAIERARAAVYPKSIAADVPVDLLRRYFVESNGSYQISKSVRDLCVFARQDVTRDPPFSKLDLIVCRNVLIYLAAPLQNKLMRLFHYALRPHGFLMLGHAETVGAHADLFAVTDKKHRVYARKSAEASSNVSIPAEFTSRRRDLGIRPHAEPQVVSKVQGEANRVLLDKYTPPGVIVDSTLQIVQFRGATGPFLEPAPGDASLHLLKMAREGLTYGLRNLLRAARKSKAPVRRDGFRVKRDGHSVDVALEVIPLGPASDDRHYLILFQEVSPSHGAAQGKAGSGKRAGATAKKSPNAAVARLEQELAANREYLQSIIQDMEAANEELQSANEEIMSSNEELQSTNEELDTAKEELQSTNEELSTLNEELHGRNEELTGLNSDLVNFLASVQIAIVMVSGDLRIRRVTPVAERLLNLMPSDVGRPISHMKLNFECPNLDEQIREVIQTMEVKDLEVQDRERHWHLLRIRPYKNIEHKIDGAVLTLSNIDARKQQEEQFDEVTNYAASLLDSLHEPVLLLDRSLALRAVNRAYGAVFGQSESPGQGTSLESFHGGVWNEPKLRSMLEKVLATQGGSNDYEITADFPGQGRKTVRLNARWFAFGSGQEAVLVAMRVGTN